VSDQGFIKIDRGIVDHWVFKSDPECRIWIYIIHLGNFDIGKKPIRVGGKEMYLKRGEFCCTIQNVADFLLLDYSQVRRCFDLFKRNNMIEKLVEKGYKIPYVAKVVNYDKWQGIYQFKHNQSTINRQSKHNQPTFNLQDKNNSNNYNNGYNENGKWIYQCEVCEKQEINEFHNLVTTCCDLQMTRYSVEQAKHILTK
jgi:hypothetical protein